jgi:hypothetical protein
MKHGGSPSHTNNYFELHIRELYLVVCQDIRISLGQCRTETSHCTYLLKTFNQDCSRA